MFLNSCNHEVQLDASLANPFGLIYLDYCCSLTSGKDNIEKSPTHDMHALFATGACDPSRCILGICLSNSMQNDDTPAKSEFESQGQRTVSQVVCSIAAQYGYHAEYDASRSFDYEYDSNVTSATHHCDAGMHLCVFHVYKRS